jgi:plastocyanin
MKAKFFWLILSLGALLRTACSSVMAPPPGDFNVTARASPQEYVVNGTPRPELTLTRGTTYTFSVNASGHPFIITTSSTGGPSAPEDVAGVTGEGAAVGTVTFTPDTSTPDAMYYQCEVHTGMGNAIHVVN